MPENHPKESIQHSVHGESLKSRVELVSDRVSYMILRGHWCNIIVLNVQAPREEKSDDSKYSFYEELEQVFHHFPE